MNIDFGISTRCFQSRPLTSRLLEHLRRADFTRIEIYSRRPGLDYHDRSLIRSIAAWFKEATIGSASLHLPFEEDLGQGKTRPFSLLHSERRVRQDALDEIKRCLELSERIPLDYAVLHLGDPGEDFNPVKFDFAYAAIAAIQAFAGVRVLLENIPNRIATVDRLIEFKEAAQLQDVGICYDTGHGRLGGMDGIGQFDLRIADLAQAIHIHDNHGADEHLWPFDGTTNWRAFIEVLAQSKFKGPLIFEPVDDDMEKARDCRSRFTDLMHEAENSIEEFRSKYRLPFPQVHGEE